MEHHNTPCTAPCARSEEPVIAHRVYESPCIEVLSVSMVSAFLALSGQTGGWHNDTNIPMGYSNPIEYAATNSAKDMPNVNDLTWYIQYGDPHFDGTTEWSLGGVKQRGGLWLKKKEVIISEIQSSQPNVFVRYRSYDGTDWRNGRYNTLSTTPAAGRPSDTSDYFFLPALGYYGRDTLGSVGTYCYYWSSSPNPDYYTAAYSLKCYSDEVRVESGNGTFRWLGCVAGCRPDGTPWFK